MPINGWQSLAKVQRDHLIARFNSIADLCTPTVMSRVSFLYESNISSFFEPSNVIVTVCQCFQYRFIGAFTHAHIVIYQTCMIDTHKHTHTHEQTKHTLEMNKDTK